MSGGEGMPGGWTRALVVFGGEPALWWLRLLPRGFRHCFVVLGSPSGWLVMDPLSHQTQLSPLGVEAGFDLAGWYRAHGLTVVEVPLRPAARRAAPWRPFTCVEAVKRVLGVHAGGVFTPRQLYRHLLERNKVLDNGIWSE